jgi:hypothetical protein
MPVSKFGAHYALFEQNQLEYSSFLLRPLTCRDLRISYFLGEKIGSIAMQPYRNQEAEQFNIKQVFVTHSHRDVHYLACIASNLTVPSQLVESQIPARGQPSTCSDNVHTMHKSSCYKIRPPCSP